MAFEAFLAQEIELHHPGDLEVRAWELAGQYDRSTAYDASYLALAESAGCELWTADGRLVKAVAARWRGSRRCSGRTEDVEVG